MKFKSQVYVVGMKKSKGVIQDSGQAYDSTKVYVLVDMDQSKGACLGQASAEYQLGLSTEFEKYAHMTFPFVADAEFEVVTNGKTVKQVLLGVVPVQRKQAA